MFTVPGDSFATTNNAGAQANFEYLITSDVTVTTITVGHLLGKYVRLQKSGIGINAGSAINLLEIEVFEGKGIDLSIFKSVSDTSPKKGDTITFTLTLKNLCPVEARILRPAILSLQGLVVFPILAAVEWLARLVQ